MKICSICKIKKPLAEFWKDSKTKYGVRSNCIFCSKTKYCSTTIKQYKLKHRYGITLEQYESLLEQQDGKCKICKQVYTRTLNVDHCHHTGNIRGLLCLKCNSLLGYADDNIDLLNAAIKYLKT